MLSSEAGKNAPEYLKRQRPEPAGAAASPADASRPAARLTPAVTFVLRTARFAATLLPGPAFPERVNLGHYPQSQL